MSVLGACQTSAERRVVESCGSTPQCAVGLDCVVLRAEPGGSTAGAGFCTFRCAPRFPCAPPYECTAVDADGVVVAMGDSAARNAFCLRPCEEDRQCAVSLDCEDTAADTLCF